MSNTDVQQNYLLKKDLINFPKNWKSEMPMFLNKYDLFN